MRNICIALVAFLILFAASITAQTVTITSQKKVYTRAKPIVDFKKTFTVDRPIAKAATPALSKKITAAIDPLTILGVDIQDELTETQWLSEVGFKEVFNARGVLTMELWMEGSGAYISGVTKYVVVDVATGNRVKPSDIFNDIPGLLAAVKKKQDAEVDKAVKEIKADPEWLGEDPRNLFEYTDFTEKELDNFVVDMAGVAFVYDYGFPNVVKALAPEGEYRFTIDEIKPFIQKGGLLARFVR